MYLSELISRLPICQLFGEDVEIEDLAYDSRAVKSGGLFVALRGAKSDGHDYIAEATNRGAIALVVNSDRSGWYSAQGVATVVVPDTRKALPLLAAAFYGDPSLSLQVIGVTGTNGKTTTSHLIDSIFRILGERAGLIGTLGATVDGRKIPTERTTPESADLQRLFAEMLVGGVRRVVMEVSSEGTLQERATCTAFDIGVFTNLTQDHLNTHGTIENYFAQKRRLFTEFPDTFQGKAFLGVINADDAHGRILIRELEAAGRPVLRYSLTDPTVALSAEVHEARADGTTFTIRYRPPAGSMVNIPVTMQIGGLFNVANALAAAGTAIACRVPYKAIQNGLEALTGVPGRFEPIPAAKKGFQVVVDYAHSPDGLENVLRSARALNPSRLVCVFGCGGDRDPIKRPQMGRIAVDLADLTVVTSDNPRTEDPDRIIEAILAGIEGGRDNERVVVEADRRRAIERTLCELGQPGDLIVIAGKGHETGQILADRTIPFDDRLVAREVLSSCS